MGLWLILAILIPSCTSDPLDVDVSDVSVEMEYWRFDQAVFADGVEDYGALNAELSQSYAPFYAEYLDRIIGVGRPDDPMVETLLAEFATDANWRETQQQVETVFGDLTPYKTDFERAFRYHRYHFPADTIPTVVFYNSGFNVGVYPSGSYLGVGLEWFLGPENPVIQRLAIEEFPQYLKAKLRPEYMVNNAVKGWLMVKHQSLVQKEDLINLMLFHGKILYLMDAMFPDVPDEVKINYAQEDLQWCQRNEYNIWAHFIDAELLYTTSPKDLAGFLSDGPFTAAFSQESPARTGVWMGWQILRQYMSKNPDVSLRQMLAETNNQKFLKYYKP